MRDLQLVFGLLVAIGTVLVDSAVKVTFSSTEISFPFPGSNRDILQMEVDKYKSDGSILFGTYQYLISTNGRQKTTVYNNKNRYNLVSGFAQLNSSYVAVVDRFQDCIKMVNRLTGEAQDFAGTCGNGQGDTRDTTDGVRGVGKLFHPWGISADVNNPDRLLVTDEYNSLLRSIDKNTGELGTVPDENFIRPRAMTWVENSLLVSDISFITNVTWVNGTLVSTKIIGDLTSNSLASVQRGDVDGSFSVSRFESLASGLVEVGDGFFLLADTYNKKVKLVNMNTQNVSSSVDTGMESKIDAFTPGCMLKVGNDIYISASYYGIYKLSGMIISNI